MQTIDEAQIAKWCRRGRPVEADKSAFGHILVLGGDQGMWGAVYLAAKAALKMGAGLVSVLTHQDHAPFVSLNRPEIMSAAFQNEAVRLAVAARATHIVVGPGLTESSFSESVLSFALAQHKPLLLDAGALRMLSKHSISPREAILTPHAGEAGSLLGTDKQLIQHDRETACMNLVERYHAVVVLKGAGTLIGAPGVAPIRCAWGNPYMASGGMGDALSGLIAGCLAQGFSSYEAALTGVALHARAGDALMQRGPHGFLADELIDEAGRCLNAYFVAH